MVALVLAALTGKCFAAFGKERAKRARIPAPQAV
jgi:hypothetical protein